MRILVIAPHPDDEVLGCGATIAKYAKAGQEIHLAVVTKAYAPEWSEEFIKRRPKEVKRASKVLGVKQIYFFDFPTVKLDTIPQKDLNQAILNIIEKIRPDKIYLPHAGDLNKDHRLVYESALVALRPFNKIKVKEIFCYETLSETDEGKDLGRFSPNVYECVDWEFKKKLKAMKVYASEIKKHPHPRSLEMMEIMAKKRGAESGYELAEAFMLIRQIND